MSFKVCTLCKIQKKLEEFNKKSSSKDGLQNVCRQCNSERNRIHYENNSVRVKKRASKRRSKVRTVLKNYILNYLKKNPCVDCGESDLRCLEFDHLKDKKYNISHIIRNANSIECLILEINKCQVRCANCHRKKTATDFKWYKC